jgi:hypothetical protein
LPQSGHAWPDIETAEIGELVSGEIVDWVRAWANQTHFTAENVPQLW